MAKIRVYELAKEFGVETRVLLAAVQESGFFLRSGSSTVEGELLALLWERFGRPGESRVQPTVRPTWGGGPRPGNNPFVGTTGQQRGSSVARPRPPRPARPSRRPWVAVVQLPPLERLLAKYEGLEGRIPADVHARLTRNAARWADQWLTPQEIEPWLAMGVQPETAGQCVQAGITPALLEHPFRIPGKPLHGGHLTLKQALDRQAVTVSEIRDDLVRIGVLKNGPQVA